MRSEIILETILHEEKLRTRALKKTVYMDEKEEVYSPTYFINQPTGKIKVDNDETNSCSTPSSARSSYFTSVEDVTKVPVTPPGIPTSVPFSNHKGVVIPGEIIRPIPVIPLDSATFTTILSPPTYLENPPQLPVAPVVRISNSGVRNGENQVSGSPPHLPMFTDQQEQENIQLQDNVVHCCHWLNCTESFVSMDDLVNHVNDSHVKVERPDVDYQCKWNNCPRRGKGFNARYKMLIHIRTHTNEKPHKCSLCGKSFSRLENLKIHNRSHTGEKPYVCPFPGCTKAYSNSSDRFKHVRTHQEDKPYICKMPGCNKRYTDPSSLRKHVRTHGHYFRENEQPESSTICSKSPSAQNNEQVSPIGSINSSIPSSIHTVQPALFPFTPLSGTEIGHGARIIQLPGFSSNPLLSSTILTNTVLTNSISTQTDSVVTMTTLKTLPRLSIIPKKVVPEGALLESDDKCQECPLDLSTSPSSIQSVDFSINSKVSSPVSPSSQEVSEVVSPRWEAMNA